MKQKIDFKKAFETNDINEFINIVFPIEWKSVMSRILETGVTFGETEFVPIWTKIPYTIRKSKTGDINETYLKSVLFRVHDVLHQCFPVPIPKDFSEDEYYLFKRNWMCAEVAVLTLTEFVYASWLTTIENYSDIEKFMDKRNALKMLETTELKYKTPTQIAGRLDALLHKKVRPRWVRQNEYAIAFCDDYVAMLEEDRMNIDWNWQLMKDNPWFMEMIKKLPNGIFVEHLDGLELTTWMVEHFFILKNTSPTVDYPLVDFNRYRRAKIDVPKGWNNPTQEFKEQWYNKNNRIKA